MLVDQQWLWKENRALARRLQSAKLKERGFIEDIDYQHPRGLDRKLHADAGRQRMGAPKSEHSLHRPHRHRQKLAGLRSGTQSLPGRLFRAA